MAIYLEQQRDCMAWKKYFLLFILIVFQVLIKYTYIFFALNDSFAITASRNETILNITSTPKQYLNYWLHQCISAILPVTLETALQIFLRIYRARKKIMFSPKKNYPGIHWVFKWLHSFWKISENYKNQNHRKLCFAEIKKN